MKSFKEIRRNFLLVNICLCAILLTGSSFAAEGMAAKVFERLKGLEGTWTGTARQTAGEPHHEGAGEELQALHEFRVSSAGSVVMEIMGPKTPYEMINMYHLDGQDLVLTHYCAAGNQPTMKLNQETSTADTLVFDFTGGTNLNPAVDQHIHNAKIVLSGDKNLKSYWTSYSQGKEQAEMLFTLEREP